MKKPYAITNLIDNSEREVEEETWRSKEIEARLFELRADEQPYGPLWDSVHEWADWARQGTTWVHAKLEAIASKKYAEANPFQIELFQDIFSVLEDDERIKAAEHLNALKVDFGWIAAIDAAIDPSVVGHEASRS
jgi:hypothetical protein